MLLSSFITIVLLIFILILYVAVLVRPDTTPRTIQLTPTSARALAQATADCFQEYGIEVSQAPEERPDDDGVECRWRTYTCPDSATLAKRLNDEANDGWEVYQILPVDDRDRFLLVMCAPRDFVSDEDEAHGDPACEESLADRFVTGLAAGDEHDCGCA